MQNNVTTHQNASGNAGTTEPAVSCTSTHTPWQVAPSGNAICTVEGTLIAKGLNHDIHDAEAVAANACLIAAAPDLYRSLAEVMALAENPDQDTLEEFIIDGIWARAREALAKVEGEEGQHHA